MITLRCTRKLLDRLGVPADAKPFDGPTNALGDWYVNLVRFGREQLVMATSERSLLTVVMPARQVRHRLVPDLLAVVRMVLRELDVPGEVVAREIAAMQPAAFAPTASRSVLASMNNLAQMAEWQWDRASPVDVMLRLAEVPMSALEGEGGRMGRPGHVARRLLGLGGSRPAPARLLRLRIALEGPLPAIWRRLLVPDSISLPDLHTAFQLAMGWTDSHLHAFDFGGTRYGVPDPEGLAPSLRDEEGQRLADVLARHGANSFRYLYDFGDDWMHAVTVEGEIDNLEGLRGPECTDGANACPPEDVGGPPGYMAFLEALRDPAHPEHREIVRWAGGRFDPTAWDRGRANLMLRILRRR